MCCCTTEGVLLPASLGTLPLSACGWELNFETSASLPPFPLKDTEHAELKCYYFSCTVS